MTAEPAIFFLANDRVLGNVVKLLASLKFHGFSNRMFYIPFNDEMSYATKAFASFGVERYEEDLGTIDDLGRKIYDDDPPANPYPYCLGKLRKLSFLTFPGQAVYLDADCIVTCKPDLFNGVFSLSEPGIGYINTSPDGVYEEVPEAEELRSRSAFLTSGMMSKSEGRIWIADLDRRLTPETIAAYLKVRRRGGYVDQPLWNYLVDCGFLSATDLLKDRGASRITSVNADLTVEADGSVRACNMPVLLLHLAGPVLKNIARYRFLLDGMMLSGLRKIASGDEADFVAMSRFLLTDH